MSQLTFRYEYSDFFDDQRDDPEEAGRLTVSVVTEQFSGTVGVWVPPEWVRVFGESLSTFPITSDKPLEAVWSYSHRMSSVMISPANPTGTLLVTVEITDEDGRVWVSFVTHYPQIEAFRRSIANLMDRKVDEAILRGWSDSPNF
jgi:hypothetical protein